MPRLCTLHPQRFTASSGVLCRVGSRANHALPPWSRKFENQERNTFIQACSLKLFLVRWLRGRIRHVWPRWCHSVSSRAWKTNHDGHLTAQDELRLKSTRLRSKNPENPLFLLPLVPWHSGWTVTPNKWVTSTRIICQTLFSLHWQFFLQFILKYMRHASIVVDEQYTSHPLQVDCSLESYSAHPIFAPELKKFLLKSIIGLTCSLVLAYSLSEWVTLHWQLEFCRFDLW